MNKSEKNKYKELFEKRFNQVPNISVENNEFEFPINLIGNIKIQYRNQICKKLKDEDKTAANNYIEDEKIRLEVNINQLENKKVGTNYIQALFSTAVPIVIFAASHMFSLSLGSVKFAADNKAIELPNNAEAMSRLTDIFKQFSLDIIEMVGIIAIVLLVVIAAGLISLEIVYTRDKGKLSTQIAFNKFCLEALKAVEQERCKNHGKQDISYGYMRKKLKRKSINNILSK